MRNWEKSLKEKIKTIAWAFKMAWKIDKKMLLLWFSLSIALSALPAIALTYNRKIIAGISSFLSSGIGSFSDVIPTIITLGIILTAIGLSSRINGDLLYMMMYDSYYLGMEEVLMDFMQKIDMKTLLNKEIKDEYNAIISRGGSLTDFMSAFCVFASKIVNIGCLLIVAFRSSKAIFVLALVYVIITIYVNGSFTEKVRRDNVKIKDDERLVSYFYSMPLDRGTSKEIRIYETKDEILAQWQKAYKRIEEYRTKRMFGLEIRSFISGIGFYIFMIGVMVYEIFMVASGEITADVLLMIYVLCESMSNAISGIAKSFLQADYGLFSLERQRKFIMTIPQISSCENSKLTEHQDFEVVIQAQNVNFYYEENVPILNNINLKINKGEIVALVGHNGSGKTTLVRLLLGLFKPTSGNLYFYGKPYYLYKHGFINSCIGVFFQNFYLFHASLSENVGFGDLNNIINNEKIEKALVKGGAINILRKLPKGLKTWIGKAVDKDGAELSGGEKQKIAVSRAHMSDKEIMIFDEPASALDPIAEMEQFMNIKEKIHGRTAILISHRVGFARLADRIIVLDSGKIIEDGTHDSLIMKNGVYADLFNKQAQWYDTAKIDDTEAAEL